MTTIRKKIIFLSLCSWFMMAGIWLFLSIYNQKSVENYNQILQRYLFLNEISQLSSTAISGMNQYLEDHQEEHLNDLLFKISQLAEAKQHLNSLHNNNNKDQIINFSNMIDSQIEAMNLTLKFIKLQDREAVKEKFNEAMNISSYISEASLALLSTELSTKERYYQFLMNQSRDLRNMGFWTMALVSSILLPFTYRFANGITKPIIALSSAANKIALGNYNSPVEIQSNDEISFLSRTFNNMRISIRNSITEIQHNAQLEKDLQEHKLMLKEHELKSLQSQINPHFLFNTLNILAKKAYLEGAEETSDLISSVAGILRYNLKRLDNPVTLRDELRILEEYLTIQKTRFGERVQYDIKVDENCLHIRIPNLTIQPFVENAFIHAIEPTQKGGHITIRAHREADSVILEIIDDGLGMEEERLNSILDDSSEGKKKGHSTGIGIGNVIHRLRLFYGISDLVQITSSPGAGTCVKITLPDQNPNSVIAFE